MGWKGPDPYAGQRPEATLGVSFARRLSVWVGTGFGIGLVAPCAPGTFGSLPGVALAVAMAAWLPYWWAQVLLCAVLTLLAVPVCSVAEDCLKKKDDGRISADEWMLYPIATIGLPLTAQPWLIPLTFVVIRVLDVLKLPPARQIALAVNWALWRWLFQ